MGKLEKNIYKITWPILVEMLFFTLLGTVDTVMLSRFSDTAVGSVGVSNRILFLFGIIVNVIALGIGVVAAQYLGAKKVQKAKDTVVTGIAGNFIIGIVLSTVVVILGKSLLEMIGTNSIFMEDSVTYIRIVGLSLVFIAIRVAISNGFRSFGKPKVVMYIMIIGNLVNIAINAVLIYGLFGLPRLGVQGAAIGTVVSRIIMVAILGISAYKILDIKILKVRLHLVQLKKILFVGIPAATENLMWNIAQVFIMAIINQLTPEAVIARTYIYTILSFIFIFSFSFASGNAIIVGYFIGENQHEKAYEHTKKALRIAFLLVMFITLLLNVFSASVIGLFTDDPIIIDMARTVLYIAFFMELGRSMNFVFIHALRSAGDTVFPVIMAVISMFGVNVLFSYIFAIELNMGLVGVFVAGMLDEVFRGSSMAYRWFQRKWTKIKLIDTN